MPEDRYHARPLRTPTEVAWAKRYVLANREKHAREYGDRIACGAADAFSSADPAVAAETVAPPCTWLLLHAPP